MAPIELSWNRKQRRDMNSVTNSQHDWVFWRVAAGLRIIKRPDDNSVTFGAYLMPWGIRVDHFSFGVAIGYETQNTVQTGNSHWSLLLPVTYSLAGT